MPEPAVRRFTRVVAATDFFAGASLALARLGLLPLEHGATISLLHVIPGNLAPQAATAEREIREPRLETARQGLVQVLLKRGRTDVEVSGTFASGRAYAEIASHARSLDADLIVLGRHGRRPLRGAFLGSTAERVVRAGEAPVLIAGRKPLRPYERPLVGVDLEEGSAAVVECGARLLGPGVGAVTLLHACQPPFEGFVAAGASPLARAGYRRACREASAAGVAELAASLERLGLRFRRLVHIGDARAAILSEARRRRADLVVVGTHARSGISHALLGSVAERVVRAAECDVLVARPFDGRRPTGGAHE